MFLLNFIPDAYLQLVLNIIIGLGVVLVIFGTFLSNILKRWWPPIEAYMYLVHIVAIVAIGAGSFFKGGYETEIAWRTRTEQLQAKVDQAQKESKDANTKLAKKYAQKQKVIVVRQAAVKQYIDREIVKYDSKCVIPPEFIKAHNDSAEEPK